MKKKLLKESLLHFLLIGAALFMLFYWTGNSEGNNNTIIIDESDVIRIVNSWEMKWKRPPTENELKGLLDEYVRQEILYSEALNMNLDHNDEIIKRRLAKKMEFLTNDLATFKEPTEDELKNHFEENQQKFRNPKEVSFMNVFLSNETRDDAESDARKLLPYLPVSPTMSQIRHFGDPTLIENDYKELDKSGLSRIFGYDFAEEVFLLESGKWSGPVTSVYGQHLIFIYNIKKSSLPRWEKVKKHVNSDYQYQLLQKYNESVYQGLLDKYEVKFEFNDSLDYVVN